MYWVYIKSASAWGQDIREKKSFEVCMLILFEGGFFGGFVFCLWFGFFSIIIF